MIESDRLIDPAAGSSEEAQDRAVRPKSLQEYIGQRAVREQMEIFLAAAQGRKPALREATSHACVKLRVRVAASLPPHDPA